MEMHNISYCNVPILTTKEIVYIYEKLDMKPTCFTLMALHLLI